MRNGVGNVDYGLEFSLNYLDYELYPPSDLDQKRHVSDPADSFHQNVPIIRIFGRTDAGQHVCSLIHGVFPYMYIEYDGPVNDDMQSKLLVRLTSQAEVLSLV